MSPGVALILPGAAMKVLAGARPLVCSAEKRIAEGCRRRLRAHLPLPLPLANAKIPRTGIRAQEWRYERVTPVAVKGGVMMIVKDVTANRDFVITNTKEHVCLIGSRIFVQGVAIVLRDLDPAEIFPEVDIDHTSHGVRAVHRRSA